jgi:hypothetical protein
MAAAQVAPATPSKRAASRPQDYLRSVAQRRAFVPVRRHTGEDIIKAADANRATCSRCGRIMASVGDFDQQREAVKFGDCNKVDDAAMLAAGWRVNARGIWFAPQRHRR